MFFQNPTYAQSSVTWAIINVLMKISHFNTSSSAYWQSLVKISNNGNYMFWFMITYVKKSFLDVQFSKICILVKYGRTVMKISLQCRKKYKVNDVIKISIVSTQWFRSEFSIFFQLIVCTNLIFLYWKLQTLTGFYHLFYWHRKELKRHPVIFNS